MSNAIWVTPLLLLPGVALLVMSTSARFAQIHGEIHGLAEGHPCGEHDTARGLLRRSILFRNALVGLYIAVASLALAGLTGGLASLFSANGTWVVMAFTCIGIGCLLYAAVQLIQESLKALDIVEKHVMDLLESEPGNNQ